MISATNSGYDVGDTVSDFRLKNFDGRMVSLFDYKDTKGVILIFDCNTCPYSKAYNDRIIALHKNFAPQGFPVVTINPNDGKQSPGDSFEEMVARARRKNYAFPYLLDDSQRVAKALIPSLFRRPVQTEGLPAEVKTIVTPSWRMTLINLSMSG